LYTAACSRELLGPNCVMTGIVMGVRGQIRLEIAIRKAADVEGSEDGLGGEGASLCACVVFIGVTERARDPAINYSQKNLELI